ncbi:MAG: sulfotransferase [Pseudomonadota bacterium]
MSAAQGDREQEEASGAAAVPLHFLLAGFSKCGTTTLHGLLNDHPEIYMPTYPRKEPWFFSHFYHRGWGGYAELFQGAYLGQRLGEASTSYSTYSRETAARRRILEHYPDIKLIFIARDPVDRIESAFREMHHSGANWGTSCPFSLERALREVPALLADSAFSQRLHNYRRHVSPEQIKVVLLEELNERPDAILRELFDFLEVDSSVRIERSGRKLNAGLVKLRDSEELRKLRNVIWSPRTGEPLRQISPSVADQFLLPLGLRQRFTPDMIDWTEQASHAVVDALFEDSCDFLKSIGKPPETWPRMCELARRAGLSTP